MLERLDDDNIYLRETAQRLLAERACQGVVEPLQQIVLDPSASHRWRMHALWSLYGGKVITPEFARQLLASQDASLRGWGVRATASLMPQDEQLAQICVELAKDTSPDVQLQVAIAAGKLQDIDALATWITILANCGDDSLIPHIVWQNLHPRLPEEAPRLLEMLESVDLEKSPGLAEMLPHVAEKLQD